MKDFVKSKLFYVLAGIAIILICIIVCFFMDKNNMSTEIIEENNEIEQSNVENELPKTKAKIFIHIDGEVCNPGVYEVYEGSRIKDVIDFAGGITAQADISNVNFAYQLEDGQKIKIPNIHEKNQEKEKEPSSSIIQIDDGGVVMDNNKTNKKININTATQSELEALSGIGPSMAAKIITYRKDKGKFKKIEDIKNVPGIGNAKFEAIKDDICV